VPAEYGGAGLDYLSYGLIVEEIGRGDSAIRTVISVQTSLVCSAILKWGTEEQKHHYLPRLCSGEWLGCFGLTEPDTGSDAANQRTRAKKTDSGWVINGAKMWISMGNYAKVALIFAQTDPELGYKGLACFLVDTDQAGYKPQTIEHKMGLHASDTASIALEDVEVSDDQMLGGIGDGFKVAMSALDSGRYSVAAGCVGICQGCVEESVKYAKERQQFGRPIASFQLVQAMIADMVLKTDASRMLVWRAGFLKDQGRPNTLETSVAKLHATEASLEWGNLADPETDHGARNDGHRRARSRVSRPASIIGVLGAGTMGAGIAQLACRSGARTLLHDPIPEALHSGAEKLRAGLRKEAARGRLSAEEADAAAVRLEAVDSLEAFAPCELIIEAVPERLELKHEIYARLSEIVSEEWLLATNPSALLGTASAAAASRPERVVGMHFFNPAPLMRLLEVVAGEESSPESLALAHATGEAMGKTVIRASDGPGFLVNRCNRPFGLEALRLAQE